MTEQEQIGSSLGKSAGALAGNLIPIPGVGPLIGGIAGSFLGSKVGGMFSKPAPKTYTQGEINTGSNMLAKGGKTMYLKGGKVMFMGKNHEQGGIKLPNGDEVEGGETAMDIKGGKYIFSKRLFVPGTSETFAQAHLRTKNPKEALKLASLQEKVSGRSEESEVDGNKLAWGGQSDGLPTYNPQYTPSYNTPFPSKFGLSKPNLITDKPIIRAGINDTNVRINEQERVSATQGESNFRQTQASNFNPNPANSVGVDNVTNNQQQQFARTRTSIPQTTVNRSVPIPMVTQNVNSDSSIPGNVRAGNSYVDSMSKELDLKNKVGNDTSVEDDLTKEHAINSFENIQNRVNQRNNTNSLTQRGITNTTNTQRNSQVDDLISGTPYGKLKTYVPGSPTATSLADKKQDSIIDSDISDSDLNFGDEQLNKFIKKEEFGKTMDKAKDFGKSILPYAGDIMNAGMGIYGALTHKKTVGKPQQVDRSVLNKLPSTIDVNPQLESAKRITAGITNNRATSSNNRLAAQAQRLGAENQIYSNKVNAEAQMQGNKANMEMGLNQQQSQFDQQHRQLSMQNQASNARLITEGIAGATRTAQALNVDKMKQQSLDIEKDKNFNTALVGIMSAAKSDPKLMREQLNVLLASTNDPIMKKRVQGAINSIGQ
jgi:hypothetical protein